MNEWLKAVLAGVSASAAIAAIAFGLRSWWRSRNWTELNEMRELLADVMKDDSFNDTARNTATEARQALTIELAARSQRRASAISEKRSSPARYVAVTAAGVAMLSVYGVAAVVFAAGYTGPNHTPAEWVLAATGYGLTLMTAVAVAGMIYDRRRTWNSHQEYRELHKAVRKADRITSSFRAPTPTPQAGPEPETAAEAAPVEPLRVTPNPSESWETSVRSSHA